MQMYDQLDIDDAAKVRIIDGGYLCANPRIARTGIQLYGGDEVGRPDMEKVRVYRPEDSVFAKAAVNTYTHLPVTLDHPGVMVNATNWKDYAIGHTGEDVLRDGGTVRVPMMVRDAAAIKLIKDGVKQLSVGYTCDLEWKDGVTSDGEHYDAIQKNIRANHLAVVPTARGGSALAIGDDRTTSQGDSEMTTLQKYTIDGVSIEMTDVAHQVVHRALTSVQTMFDEFKKKKEKEEEEADDSIKKKDAALAAADAVIKTKDAEIAALNTKLAEAEVTPEKLDALSVDRNNAIDKAKAILGDSYSATGKKAAAIRREVVLANARLKDMAKDWDDNKIEASFNTMSVTLPVKGQTIDHARAAFASPFAANGLMSDGDTVKKAAYDAYDEEAKNAWRNPAGMAKQ